jgi:hypothetical protein
MHVRNEKPIQNSHGKRPLSVYLVLLLNAFLTHTVTELADSTVS